MKTLYIQFKNGTHESAEFGPYDLVGLAYNDLVVQGRAVAYYAGSGAWRITDGHYLEDPSLNGTFWSDVHIYTRRD